MASEAGTTDALAKETASVADTYIKRPDGVQAGCSIKLTRTEYDMGVTAVSLYGMATVLGMAAGVYASRRFQWSREKSLGVQMALVMAALSALLLWQLSLAIECDSYFKSTLARTHQQRPVQHDKARFSISVVNTAAVLFGWAVAAWALFF